MLWSRRTHSLSCTTHMCDGPDVTLKDSGCDDTLRDWNDKFSLRFYTYTTSVSHMSLWKDKNTQWQDFGQFTKKCVWLVTCTVTHVTHTQELIPQNPRRNTRSHTFHFLSLPWRCTFSQHKEKRQVVTCPHLCCYLYYFSFSMYISWVQVWFWGYFIAQFHVPDWLTDDDFQHLFLSNMNVSLRIYLLSLILNTLWIVCDDCLFFASWISWILKCQDI